MTVHPRHLYIFGAGGFGREVAWLASETLDDESTAISFIVDRQEYLVNDVNGIPVRLLDDVSDSDESAFVVALGDPQHRRSAVNACVSAGLNPMTLIHPRVERSQFVEFGAGVVLCAGVIVTTNVRIAEFVQVNLGCTIGHDAQLEEFVTLAPGVHVSGNVVVERDAYIGTGACLINGSSDAPLRIGAGAVVAAGACVTRDVEPGAMVAGVPAVRKR